MKHRTAASLSLLACLNLLAVVPPVQNVTLAWDTQAATNLVYRVYEISGPITNLLATTTNITTTLTNVLAAPHRWFVTASNQWGESDGSVPLVVPAAPIPPTNLRPVSTTLVVPLPGWVEGSKDLVDWSEKMRLASHPDGVALTQTIQPTERMMFWRQRVIAAAAPPPFPAR